nr:unnamed protein product [Callosobruchus chinensis]
MKRGLDTKRVTKFGVVDTNYPQIIHLKLIIRWNMNRKILVQTFSTHALLSDMKLIFFKPLATLLASLQNILVCNYNERNWRKAKATHQPKRKVNLAWSIAHIFGELPPLLPCLYLMQSREGECLFVRTCGKLNRFNGEAHQVGDNTSFLNLVFIFHIYKNSGPIYNTLNVNDNDSIISIKSSQSVKYLGIYIDSQLRWDSHLDFIMKKLRSIIYIFYAIKKVLDYRHLKILYQAIVEPHISYGIVSWGGVLKKHVNPLQILQKRFFKIILNKPQLYPTDMLYKECCVMNCCAEWSTYNENILRQPPNGKYIFCLHTLAHYVRRPSRYLNNCTHSVTLYKVQMRPSLEYGSHVWKAATSTALSILDAIQRKAIRLSDDPTFTCHLQPLSHRVKSSLVKLSKLFRESPADLRTVCNTEINLIYNVSWRLTIAVFGAHIRDKYNKINKI